MPNGTTSHNGHNGAMTVERPLPPCNVVIFGATGDLTHRKLIPALFSMEAQGLLPENMKIIGFARREYSDMSYRKEVKESLEKFAPDLWTQSKDKWTKFSHRIVFHRSDFDNERGFTWLKERLDEFDKSEGTGGNRLFYLATPPVTYSTVIQQLGKAGLAKRDGESNNPFIRIIVEKPFGSDLATARALNAELKTVFDEDQIYRIDHYLGKETVQNIFVFRFANLLFEPLWNGKYIDHVQITVAETVGVEARAGYFDTAGELRDMIQSHGLQLVSLVAMEPPISLAANDIRDEKVKVLRAIRAICPEDIKSCAVRGQYGPGNIDGQAVPGYRQEPNVPPSSTTDTFVALKLDIQNWRWSGVPFYIRAGKRMPQRLTEINITFKEIPPILLRQMATSDIEPNVITIRIQPDEGISVRVGVKPPGAVTRVEPIDFNFAYGSSFTEQIHDAYERLIMDALVGDAALFTRDDEAEAEWALITPVLEAWKHMSTPKFPNYPAGTWGPEESILMLAQSGRHWVNR